MCILDVPLFYKLIVVISKIDVMHNIEANKIDF